MHVSVKMARIGAGLTMRDIADVLGIHEQTYSKLEHNPEKFTIELAERFAICVNRDITDIVFLSKNSN